VKELLKINSIYFDRKLQFNIDGLCFGELNLVKERVTEDLKIIDKAHIFAVFLFNNFSFYSTISQEKYPTNSIFIFFI